MPNTAAPGTIASLKVSVSVPDTVDITRLVAKFSQSKGADVYIGDFRQISGLTSNDFTNDVTYTVVAENGDQLNYVVSVSQEATTPDPIDPVLGIGDEMATKALVFPNPFDQELFLDESLKNKAVKLTLHNTLGQTLPLTRQGESFRINHDINPGLYLLTIEEANARKTVMLLKR